MLDFTKVIELIFNLDSELIEVLLLSLEVSGAAVLLGTLLGVPLGTAVSLSKFKGKSILVNTIYTFMGFPPVLAGLLVYLFLSNSGPLGSFQLLFTPAAMIIAQTLLVTPIITGLSIVAVARVDKGALETAVSLGADPWQKIVLLIKEARPGIFAGIITGFGRAIAEVGAVMLVGGNIRHHTRVLTTSIVLETRQGNFEMAVALGLILVIIAFMINWFLQYWQGGGNSFGRRDFFP